MSGFLKTQACPRHAAGAGGDVFTVFDGPVDFEDGDAAGDGIEQLVNGGVEVVLSFPSGGFLVVEDVLHEGGFFERRIGRLLPLLRPGLKVEGKFADGVLELIEVATEALPCVLHRVEQLVLEHEVTPATFVEDPAEGLGIEVDGDRRQLVVAGVWTDDGALDSHGGSVNAEAQMRVGRNLTGFHSRAKVYHVVRNERN